MIDPDLETWVGELERASVFITPGVDAVVSRGALNIKQDAQRRISGLSHAPLYPWSISYDTARKITTVSAEIGPDKDREHMQAGLGNILEYGTVNNPPHPHLGPALEAEGPRFERALADLAAELLGG